MSMYMYVYMYVYMYMYVYVYVCVCVCVYVYMYMCIYIYMHIHISIHIYAHGWQMASFVSDSPMKDHQLPQDLHLFNTEEREWMQVAFFSDAPDVGSVRKQMASVTGGFLGKKKQHLYASK